MTSLTLSSDCFEQYIAQINQFDVLDRETEQALARRYRDHNDLEAAQQLTCANLRFVVKVANEYRAYGLKILDLIQEGNIGLMMAIKKFDPDKEIRLISYAVWWIRAYIHNYIVSSWSLVKIGTTQAQKKLFFKLRQTRDTLLNLAGVDDRSAIAKELNVSDQEVDEMTARLSGHDCSLDLQADPDSPTSWLENLADSRPDQEQQLLAYEATHSKEQMVQQALAQLSEREQQILTARYLNDEKTTLQELADSYKISKERVRQLENRALQKLAALLDTAQHAAECGDIA